MVKVLICHEGKNKTEFGYGLYINGYIEDFPNERTLYASECIKKDSSESEIKKAEKRVRQNARNAYKKENQV